MSDGDIKTSISMNADQPMQTIEDERGKKKERGGTYSSLRSFGVMIGYLGFKLPPPCILPRTSSERVSWLSRSKSRSKAGSEHGRDRVMMST